jgi:maleylpyruvate isomerase
VPPPSADIDEVHAAHRRLHQTVLGIDDEVVARPSGLPSWSVGHVLTHLARNADSVVRRLEAAQRGERVEQYPGGAAGRADGIERGANRPAAAIIDDVVTADDRLEHTMATVPTPVWEEQVATGSGKLVVASHLAFARWCEVEIHHVDLHLGYDVDDWSDAFVARMLPRMLSKLPGRCDHRRLLGWTLGRHPPPDLAPWG